MAYQSWSVVFGEQPSAAKWNILGTNDASFNDGSGIAASAITPEKLFTGTGTTWPLQSWSPTLSDRLVNGDWTLTDCKYVQVGKLIVFRFAIVASDSTPTANSGTSATFTLPVTSVALASAGIQIGSARLRDATGSIYPAVINHASTTTATIRSIGVSGANTIEADLSISSPFTWTTSDGILGFGIYEAA